MSARRPRNGPGWGQFARALLLVGLAACTLVTPRVGLAQVSATITVTPTSGTVPMTVNFSATVSGCLPLVSPPVIISLGGNAARVTAVISNPNSTPIDIWRIDLVPSNPNRLDAATAQPSGGAARSPNATTPNLGSNSPSYSLFFDTDASPKTVPVSNPLIIPAGGTLTLTLDYRSPLGQGNKTIAVSFFDRLGQPIGGTNVDYESRWSFGDGTADATYTNATSHTYATAGDYTAAFRVTCGGSTVTRTVAISARPAVGSFDAVEPAGAPRSAIRTKVAGSGFRLDILSLGVDRSALQGFTGTVKVELVDASGGGGVDAHGCNAAWPVIQRLPDVSFANQSRVATASIVEANAWRNVRVRVNYPANTTPTVAACSSDAFAIRPATFSSPLASDSDWQTAGTTRALSNAAASGGAVHRAGRPFTLRTSAVNASSVVTGNYAGTPAASVTACAGAGCGAVLGVLSIGASAVGGSLTATAATYSEVGAFALQLIDQTFAEVDAGDSTPVERHILSPVVTVGRFVPDRLDLAATATPVFLTFDDLACATRSFTYLGQRFGYLVMPQAGITARNVSGGVTASYRGVLWKLSSGAVSQVYAPLAPLSPGLDTAGIGAPVIAVNGDGTGRYAAATTDKLLFVRDLAAPQSQFDASITLRVGLADDSEAGFPGNGVIQAAPLVFDGGGVGIAFDSGRQFRYGRLRTANAYGSELLDLPVPLEAQYWNGQGFVTNLADHCTRIDVANVSLSAYQPAGFAANVPQANVSVAGRFASGRGRLVLRKPAPSAGGAVTLCVDLDNGAGGDTSCTAAVPANLTHLQDRRSGASYTQDPLAKATFGVYKAPVNVIYLRENY